MVGFTFSNKLNFKTDSINCTRACFLSYSFEYDKYKNYYVSIPGHRLIIKFLKFLKKNVKNYSIKLIKREKSIALDKIIFYFEIKVSDEYNELSKYIIKYMCGIFLNQFSVYEKFIDKRDEDVKVCDWKFLTELNNRTTFEKRRNTNHIIYSPQMEGNRDDCLKYEWLEMFDDVKFCNEIAFKEPFSSAAGWNIQITDINKKISQTAIMNRIKTCLGE